MLKYANCSWITVQTLYGKTLLDTVPLTGLVKMEIWIFANCFTSMEQEMNSCICQMDLYVHVDLTFSRALFMLHANVAASLSLNSYLTIMPISINKMYENTE